jgi:CRISPR-associated protein Cas2
MSQRSLSISEYKGMWLFAMFDLPVVEKEERRRYTQFRKALLKDGFMMMQFSVYARYCPTEDASKVHRKRVRSVLPPEGYVRLLAVTDKQFGKMESFIGKKKQSTEEPPPQLELF